MAARPAPPRQPPQSDPGYTYANYWLETLFWGKRKRPDRSSCRRSKHVQNLTDEAECTCSQVSVPTHPPRRTTRWAAARPPAAATTPAPLPPARPPSLPRRCPSGQLYGLPLIVLFTHKFLPWCFWPVVNQFSRKTVRHI